MTEILKATHISQSYVSGNFFSHKKAHNVLRNISFSLVKGRSLGILGKNGAGKSSLTRILLGLERPKTGSVSIFQKNYTFKNDNHIRQKIQAVFQDPQSSLNPRWSARECILEPLSNFGLLQDPIAQSNKIANMVGLKSDILDKKSYLFSGGEQQRIAIARAIAPAPEILILDEALSFLDAHLQLAIIHLLQKLKQEHGITYIVIAHDLRLILHLCEEIILFDDGSIVFYVSKEEGIYNALQKDKNGKFREIFNASMRHVL